MRARGVRGAPTTRATRWLSDRGIPYTVHTYDYVEGGGAAHAAECLGIDPAAVVKTLVMETDRGDAVLVLMHGDRRVSLKKLARELGVRRVAAVTPEEAFKLTGYRVGGISPFGMAREMAVVVEASVLEMGRVWVNGGMRGVLVGVEAGVLVEGVGARRVDVAEGGPG